MKIKDQTHLEIFTTLEAYSARSMIACCDTVVSKLTKMHTFGSKLFWILYAVAVAKTHVGNFVVGSVEAEFLEYIENPFWKLLVWKLGSEHVSETYDIKDTIVSKRVKIYMFGSKIFLKYMQTPFWKCCRWKLGSRIFGVYRNSLLETFGLETWKRTYF